MRVTGPWDQAQLAVRLHWQMGEALIVSAVNIVLSPKHRQLAVAQLTLAALAAAAGRAAAAAMVARSADAAGAQERANRVDAADASSIADTGAASPLPSRWISGEKKGRAGEGQEEHRRQRELSDSLARENAELLAEVEQLRATVDAGRANLEALEEAVTRGREQLNELI
eukprot:COSAG02_NODE_1172_length_14106_cov_77.834725_5_plen_170_part_00